MASATYGDLWQRLSDSSIAKTTPVWLALFALALVCVSLATLYMLKFQHTDIQWLLSFSSDVWEWVILLSMAFPVHFIEVEESQGIRLTTSSPLGRAAAPFPMFVLSLAHEGLGRLEIQDLLLGLLLGLPFNLLMRLEFRCRPGSKLARGLWLMQVLWQMGVLLLEHHMFTLLLWDALLEECTTVAAGLTVLFLLAVVPALSVMELLSIREAAWQPPRRLVYPVLVAKCIVFLPALCGSSRFTASMLLLTASVRDAFGHVRLPYEALGKAALGWAKRGYRMIDLAAPASTSAGSTAPTDASFAVGSSAHTAPADASTAAGSSDFRDSSSTATLSLEDTSIGNAGQQGITGKCGTKLLKKLVVIPEDEVASSTEECVVGADDASKVAARGGAALMEGETHSSVIFEEYSTGRNPLKEAPQEDFQTLSQLVSAHVERVKRADHAVQSSVKAEALSDAVQLLEETFAWEDVPFLGASLEPLQKTQMCLRLRSGKDMSRIDILAAHAALQLLLLDALGQGGKQKERKPELKVMVRRLPKGIRVQSVTLQEEDTDKSLKEMSTMQLLSSAMARAETEQHAARCTAACCGGDA